ncbi:hypothetical protein Tco_0083803 [Tanacetum coccineum]
MTTPTTLPPPPQQQSTTELELAECVAALEKKLSDLEQTNKNLDNTTQNLGSRVYTLELRDQPHKIDEAVLENVKEAVQIALQAPLRDRFRDLLEEDMKELLHQRMFESGTYKSLPEHIALYETLEASMIWISVRGDDMTLALMVHHRLQLLSHQHGRSLTLKMLLQAAPSNNPVLMLSSQSKTYQYQILPTYLIQRTLIAHLPKSKQRPEWFKPIPGDERPATPEPAWVIPPSHIPDAVNNLANALATTYQAPAENSLLEKIRDMRTFMRWYFQKMGKTELTQADLTGQAYEVVKAFYPYIVQLQFQMEECYKMLTNQINWANPEGDQDSKGSGQALSISMMKAARYLDFGLELLKFYIDRHTADSSRKVVRTHMRILSVVRIKSYYCYGYDYLKEITLRMADYQEYTITEKDFKNLYPSDFEDLNPLLLQGQLNHLSGSDKHMLSTAKQLNLTKPGWDAKGFEYKHDYTIIESPCAVMFPINNNERKITRFNKIYKFSDGTLTNIMEALDYRVKEYKVNQLNPGKAKKSVKLMMEKVFRMELELMLFWSTVKVKTINGEAQLHALVDGKKLIITESTVRRDLQLEDEEVSKVPQSSNPSENVANKAVHKELGDSLVRAATSASSLELEHDSGKINKTQSKATPNESSSLGTISGGGPRCQETMGDTIAQTRFENVFKHSNDLLLARDEEITLVSVQNVDEEIFDVNVLDGEKVFVAKQEVIIKEVNDEVNVVEEVVEVINSAKLIIDVAQVSAAGNVVSIVGAATTVSAATKTTATITTVDDISLAQALEEMKSTKPKKKEVVIQELVSIVGAATTVSAATTTIADDITLAQVLKEMKSTKTKVKGVVIQELGEFNDIQANIDADHQLVERLQAQEQEELSVKEKATLFQQLLEKRRKHFTAKRA